MSGESAIRSIFEGAGVYRPARADWQIDNLDLAEREMNDIGNADRFRARHGPHALYVEELGWHVWDGRRWTLTGGAAGVRRKAHETARAIMEEVAAVAGADAEKFGGSAAKTEKLEALFKWSRQSGERRRVEAMLKEAEPYLMCGPNDLDADRFVLNLANGTLRLEGDCMDIQPHNPDDRCAKLVDVAFDADAQCPLFHRFLNRVQPDAAMRTFLQRWCGYSATGSIGEQKLVFNYGEGSNGKSVFVDTIARILGPYSATLPFKSLVLDKFGGGRGDQATPDLARLPGARFVRTSEPEQNTRLGEATIKLLTGGEPFPVRHLNKGFFDLDPQFKITMSGNHKPQIRGQDEGIWRRMMLVPWDQHIGEDERDPNLTEKLWAERSGILNWILDGTRLWLESGLPIPDQVREATRSYRTDSDPLGRFVESCVERRPDQMVQARDLYKAYCAWCRANAEQVWKEKTFSMGMQERGYEKKRGRAFIEYIGIALVNVPMDPGRSGDPPPVSGEDDYDD